MTEYIEKEYLLQEYERQRASGSVSFRNIIENAPTLTIGDESDPEDVTLHRICMEHFERGIKVGQILGTVKEGEL